MGPGNGLSLSIVHGFAKHSGGLTAIRSKPDGSITDATIDHTFPRGPLGGGGGVGG